MPWDKDGFLAQLRNNFGANDEKVAQETAEEEAQLKRVLEKLKIENVIDKKKQDDGWYDLKVQKEKLNILDRFLKILGITPTQTESINPSKYEEGNQETTPTPQPQGQVLGESATPTPEQPNLGEIEPILQMLGLGTTWANGDTKPAYPDRLVDYTNNAGQQYGIDPIILAAQQATETGGYGYTPKRGSSGERGIPQIIPSYHYQAAGVGDSNIYADMLENNDEYAIGEQARILARNLKSQGNIYDALRQYNAGGVLDNAGDYARDILIRAGLEKYIPGYNL